MVFWTITAPISAVLNAVAMIWGLGLPWLALFVGAPVAVSCLLSAALRNRGGFAVAALVIWTMNGLVVYYAFVIHLIPL